MITTSSKIEGGLCFMVLDDKTLVIYHALSREVIKTIKVKQKDVLCLGVIDQALNKDLLDCANLPKELKFVMRDLDSGPCFYYVVSDGICEVLTFDKILCRFQVALNSEEEVKKQIQTETEEGEIVKQEHKISSFSYKNSHTNEMFIAFVT